METQLDSQTTLSSNFSPTNIDVARIVPLPFSPTQNCTIVGHQAFLPENQSSFAGNKQHLPENGGPCAAGSFIERLRFIDRVASGRIEWKDVEERFDRIASIKTDCGPVVNRSDFAYCIGLKETPGFADELLVALDGRKDQNFKIKKSELHDYWCSMANPNFDSRLQIFFDSCDAKRNEKINETDIKQVILSRASTNKLSITQEEAEEYANLIMEELDKENRGYIELSQLETLFKQSSSQASPSVDHQNPQSSIKNSSDTYLETIVSSSSIEILFRTYWRRAWIITCWLITCFVLFSWKFDQYRHRKAFEVMGYCLCTAKGAAETLKFNMALILLPVCRNTITWLRKNRSINVVIPFNDNINFHKMIAGGIVIGVILHGGTHLACDFPRIAGCSHSIFRSTIGVDFENHQPSYIEILATTEVVTGITMVVLMAIAFSLATQLSRRRPSLLPRPLQQVTGFNTFWYSHHLFIFVYALLIVHSMFVFLTKNATEKTTWMYIAIPILLYVGERIVRTLRSGFYNVKIIKATTYPGKVLSLKLSKPEGFRFRSGMYIFIQCPQISPFEWHPFSLTSAPEDDHLSVHIRTLGDWSYQIYSHFQEALASGRSNYPKIYIDGPYGAASQDHVKYDIIVLIGLGIGATPFISVIRDIVHGLQKAHIHIDSINDEECAVKKVPSKAYLYWVTREQSSFEWFRDVMEEISETSQRQAVIEMHNYLTSVYRDGDELITAIQALHQAKNGVDVLSRTPVQTHLGRPNWVRVLTNLASKHEGTKIGVFYCGPSGLARELERLCTKLTTNTRTRFVFHKEYY